MRHLMHVSGAAVLDQMTEVESEVDGVYDGEVVTLDELQQLERELAKIR